MKKLLLAIIIIISCNSTSAQTALNFDGVNDYVVGTNDTSLNLSQGTIEAWIKTSNAGSGIRGILVKQYQYGIALKDNSLVVAEWGQGEKNTNVNLADNTWHHVAFSFSNMVANGSKLYIDGLPVLSFTYQVSTNFSQKIIAGAGNTSLQFFNGYLDQVRVWNTQKTDAEILANYNKCITSSETALVMFWNFDEGNNTTASDLSGNGNNGTLTNMDATTDWVSGRDCNLVAYYPFNGNAKDESGNNHHGTVFEATLTTDKDDNTNSAYEFDGLNDYIDLGDWENGGAMTFTFWARWDAFNNYSRIIDLGNGSLSNNIIVANYQNEDKLLFSTYNNASETIMFKSAIILNQWDFYTATVDENGIMTTYKNGQEIQKITGYTPYVLLRTEQFIGKSNFSADDYFKGAIDELKIYNKALTIEEIKNEYRDLAAYYPFNGNANDESGNGHDGTLVGPVLTNDKDGNAESAYYFDGTNDYIDLGDWENGGPMSFVFWARWDTFSNWNRILEIGNGQRNDDIMVGSYFDSENIAFYINKGITSNYIMMNTVAITLNQWNFYAATVDINGIMKIYKNGGLLATETNGLKPNKVMRTQQHLGLSLYPGDTYFNGAIDELRIYNSTLSQAEILNLYNYNTLKVDKIENIAANPFYVFENSLYFKNTQNLSEIKSIEVYNLMGQKVFQSNKVYEKVSLNIYKAGLYILKVEKSNGNYSTLKFLINTSL